MMGEGSRFRIRDVRQCLITAPLAASTGMDEFSKHLAHPVTTYPLSKLPLCSSVVSLFFNAEQGRGALDRRIKRRDRRKERERERNPEERASLWNFSTVIHRLRCSVIIVIVAIFDRIPTVFLSPLRRVESCSLSSRRESCESGASRLPRQIE